MRSRWALILALVPVLAVNLSPLAPAGEIRPRSAVRENPYFPLQVGNQWVYQWPDRPTLDPPAGTAPLEPGEVVTVTGQVAGSDGHT